MQTPIGLFPVTEIMHLNDRIWGDAGNDTLEGGAGYDFS
ncbi:MAG: hypothetical protein F6K14_02590 [Symploca sp. SIO2C1]|nr:hypothetical protein [Symploca sp. SIO2C1]